MKPGYSKLIINDHIIPDKGCAHFPLFADFSYDGGLLRDGNIRRAVQESA
jgi:hypothetical protein